MQEMYQTQNKFSNIKKLQVKTLKYLNWFADLRPKGRGRPQRILLGIWPDEHIRGVIRAVVFRDSHQIKDESHLSYPRIHVRINVYINCS